MPATAPSSPTSVALVSRSAMGWKVLSPSGHTLARFDGRLAQRRARRFARDWRA
jgi:hypothetical protein